MTRTVLVTGATGALGPAVVEEFRRAGYRVRAQGRSIPPALFADGVETIPADITDDADADRAIKGANVVVHMAALLHIVNPGPELTEQYRRVNVAGTANVVDAARRQGVERVVFVSTIAVYGYNRGEVLTETSSVQPANAYGVTKLEAEKIVLDARRPDGAAMGVVLRLGAVYGARVKGNYRRLLDAIVRGRFIGVGSGRNRRTLVHERDVARAMVLAASHPAAAGKIFNVTDGQLHTVRSIVGAIASAVGRRAPRLTLPLPLVRFGISGVETIARLLRRRPPVTIDALEKYVEDVAVSSDRIQRELGFVPALDLQSGWQETARELRARGEIR